MKFKKLLNGFREVDWYNGKTLSRGHWKNGNKIGYWEWFTKVRKAQPSLVVGM